MAKNLKRLLSSLICIVMIMSSFATVSALELSEVKDMPNNWSTEALTHAVVNDILQGKGEGYIHPDDYLTRAEMATIINRAFNSKVEADISSYVDVAADDWFYTEFEKALQMQTFYGTGDNHFRPSNYITREEVFIAVARALVVSTDDYSVLDKFSDGQDVSSWAKEFVASLIENGYVNGYGNGLILPKNNITRAEFAQLIYNIFKQYVPNEGVHNDLVDVGGVVIQNPGISLKDVTINGDLVIGDGVGDGVLTLTNVKVNGRLLVRGSKQITITNCEFTKGIVVKNVNGIVHFDNYRTEPVFNNLTEVTRATFKTGGTTIQPGGNGGGSGSGGGATYYTITLEANGGTFPTGWTNTISKRSGTTLDNLPTLTKENFEFGGWYKDAALTIPYTTTTVNQAFTVYAKWSAKVTFNSNGGSEVAPVVTDIGTTIAEPAEPTKTSKVFAGWYTDEACTSQFIFSTPITQNITLYAKWSDIPVNKYTVTFDSKGGSAVAAVTDVISGSKISAPAEPSYTGHNFMGWYKDELYTDDFDFVNDTITSNITLYAKWEIKKFNITFSTGAGASLVPGINDVEYGSLIARPIPDPTKDGYSFGGWYKDEACTDEFDFASDVIDGTVTTLYAKWNINTYTVTLNTNGGSSISPITVNHGETVTIPATTKANATFGGWYRDAAFTVEFDADNEVITAPVTLYAKWTYTITFNTNGGSTVSSATAVHGTTVSRPADPTKDGYIFAGWFTDAAYTVQFNFATPITESITLYANWSLIPVTYWTVIFDSKGGSSVASITDVINGAKITAPQDPSKEGCSFGGWYKDEAYTDDFDFANDTITSDITLYAKWNINTYTVTFDSKGGSDVADAQVNHGDNVAEPAQPTKAGYTFDGWYKDEAYTDDFDFVNDTITSDTTLYAKWNINTYTVTFDSDGGSDVAEQYITYGQHATMPANPTKGGYTFKGWFKADDTRFNFASELITGDITLKAKWELNSYTVSFDTKGGSAVASQNVYHGFKATRPADPTMEGHTFLDWYKDQACTEIFDFDTETILNTTTIYAKWEITTYTVSFDTDGGDVIADITGVKHGEKINEPAEPTKEGHTFMGWYKSDLTTRFDFNTEMITADTTIYVKWEINKYTVDFESNGGSAVASYTDVEYGSSIQEPTEPTRDGYIFGGWYKEDTYENLFDFANEVITDDITLYAKWDLVPKEYVIISFVTNCANTIDDKEIEKGTKITIPSVENEGYTLDGWYTTEDFKPETKIDFDTYTFNESITIYAKWVENPVYYTVKFYDGMSDEYLEGEESYISGSIIPESDIPSATTYNYKGFYKDATISALYNGSEYQHYIDPAWYYKGDDGKWKLFDISTDAVMSDLELHYGAKWLAGSLYINKVGHGFEANTPYELDMVDSYFTNVAKDLIFRNKNKIKNAYDTAEIESKLLTRLNKYGVVDEDKNILIQYIDVKFATILGEDEVRDFTVENAKRQLKSNADLREDLSEHIQTMDHNALTNMVYDALVACESHGDQELKEYTEFLLNTYLAPGSTYMDAADLIATQMQHDEAFELDMIDHLIAYLDAHPEELDKVVDEILREGAYKNMLDKFVSQMINGKEFDINEENKFIAQGMLIKLSEMQSYEDMFEMVPAKFRTYYKKIEKYLPKDVIENIYSQTMTTYINKLEDAVNGVTSTTSTKGNTYVTVKINPVIDLMNPLYDKAINKAEMKLNNHFFYNENAYLQEMLDIITPEAFLDGDDSLATDILSGYKLKEFDDYYFLMMQMSVLTDDAAQWYMDNIGEEKTVQMLDSVETRVMKLFSYYNKVLALAEEYAVTGEIPDKLDNEFVNKIENVVNTKFPYFQKLLDKFMGSKLNRPLVEDDYDKIRAVVDLFFRNRTFSADSLFDSAYADKIDKFRKDIDTYQAEHEKVGTATLERYYE